MIPFPNSLKINPAEGWKTTLRKVLTWLALLAVTGGGTVIVSNDAEAATVPGPGPGTLPHNHLSTGKGGYIFTLGSPTVGQISHNGTSTLWGSGAACTIGTNCSMSTRYYVNGTLGSIMGFLTWQDGTGFVVDNEMQGQDTVLSNETTGGTQIDTFVANADKGFGGQFICEIYKGSDEGKTSDTAENNDSSLSCAGQLTGVAYAFEAYIIFTEAGGGIDLGMFGCTASVGLQSWQVWNNSDGVIAQGHNVGCSSTNGAIQIAAGSVTNNEQTVVQITGSAASLSSVNAPAIIWAQNSSSVSATTVKAGSWLRVRRIESL